LICDFLKGIIAFYCFTKIIITLFYHYLINVNRFWIIISRLPNYFNTIRRLLIINCGNALRRVWFTWWYNLYIGETIIRWPSVHISCANSELICNARNYSISDIHFIIGIKIWISNNCYPIVISLVILNIIRKYFTVSSVNSRF
jgi:hypothetical protein